MDPTSPYGCAKLFGYRYQGTIEMLMIYSFPMESYLIMSPQEEAQIL